MKKIDAEQLKEMRGKNQELLLVNTLGEENFGKTKIPGAVNVPQSDDDFVDRVEQLAGSKDKAVIVYCANTECDSSKHAAEKLEQAGFGEVYDFEAGAQGWKDAGEVLAAT